MGFGKSINRETAVRYGKGHCRWRKLVGTVTLIWTCYRW